MTIRLRPATENDIRRFAAWSYLPPYDVYNLTLGGDEAVSYYGNPETHCRVLVEDGVVVGFCTFGGDGRVPGGTYDDHALDIGLGIKPELTGLGNGHCYTAPVIAHARASFGPLRLRATIAHGNTRALRVWSAAGFSEVARFVSSREVMGSNEFVVLALDPSQRTVLDDSLQTRDGPV